MNRSHPPASAGFLGLLITILALLWLLTGCAAPTPGGAAGASGVTPTPRLSFADKRATAMAGNAPATPAPATATPTPIPATPPPPCGGAPDCGHCEWRRGEDGVLVPFLIYEDGRAERMTDSNHAWNVARVCPAP